MLFTTIVKNDYHDRAYTHVELLSTTFQKVQNPSPNHEFRHAETLALILHGYMDMLNTRLLRKEEIPF